jgi:SNF2 family DNA or RNA helicase
MFSSIDSIFNIVKVEERNNIVYVTGTSGTMLGQIIERIFKTSRISNNIFIYANNNKFTFYSFFVPEMLYVLDRLLNPKKRETAYKPRILHKIKEGILQNTWIKNSQEEYQPLLDRNKLNDFIFEPLDFQKEFFDIYEKAVHKYNLKGYLFAAAAGGGKTYSSLALTHCIGAKKVLVVCPNNALHKVWENSLKTLFKPNIKIDFWISDSNIPFTGKEKYIVCNYEYLSKLLDKLPLIDKQDIAIILDESHNMAELTAARTNYFIELCQKTECNNVIWLSGTPIKAVSLETIPLIRCIDPLFTEDVEKHFRGIFKGNTTTATELLKNRLEIVSFKVAKDRLKLMPPIMEKLSVEIPDGKKFTLDAIAKDMAKYIEERTRYYKARQTKDEKDFYEYLNKYDRSISNRSEKRMYSDYRDALSRVIRSKGDTKVVSEEMKFCNSFEKTYIGPTLSSEERKHFREIKTIVKYVHLKIRGECLGNVVSRARINCHVEMSKYINFEDICDSTEKKTVVFTSFKDVIMSLKESLPKQSLRPEYVYGDTNKQLPEIITSFEKNDNINPLVATYASLSTAVPLVMADTMVLIDTPFRDYILNQAISRIHRLGSTTQVKIYTCVLNTGDIPNISTRTVDILTWSQKEINKIIGIESPYDVSDVDENGEMTISVENTYIDALFPEDNFAKSLEDFSILINGEDLAIESSISYGVW